MASSSRYAAALLPRLLVAADAAGSVLCHCCAPAVGPRKPPLQDASRWHFQLCAMALPPDAQPTLDPTPSVHPCPSWQGCH